ncbi:cell division control protein 6 homolog [Trachemys scripta elegans]|uniref:cell division control protein 6 homolog n=1 Tax=Trachemys scripta elegans TaxID=31138 RepID=UPI001554B623|nr:cell division control protein 6 homolog [Trachemys scripta elegans]
MPSTRSQTQAAIDFPRRKQSRTPGAPAAGCKDAPSNPTRVTLLTLSPREKVLPLSPRKRLGDDNLCNIPQSLPCSPTKQSKGENELPSASHKGRRLFFTEQPTTDSPGKRNNLVPSPLHKRQETPRSSERSCLNKQPVCIQLFKQEGTCYQQAKSVLHTAVPDRLLAREKETDAIRQFLKEHVCGEKPGSLYISGAPGTGKTACLSRILQDFQSELPGSKTIVLNCMSLSSSQAVFLAIAEQMGQQGASKVAGRDLVRKLEKQLTAEGMPMTVLVLDEMDQLDSKGQDVLYTVFEWPWLIGSRLVLIGVANALDLTDRILARLQARPKCKPQLLNFSPYTKEQIASILQERLRQVSGAQVLDSTAIQFCARKVSAVSGDARKALDVCRRAIEMVELDVRSQTVFKPLPGCKSPATSASVSPVPRRVGLPHISRVISDVYGDRMALGSDGASDSFPLQQKILVCSLLLLARQLKAKEVTLGKLHEAYSRVCRRQQMAPVAQSDCLSLATLLESRGILALKKAKEARLTKVSLKIEEKDVEHALKDGVLIGNILAGGQL